MSTVVYQDAAVGDARVVDVQSRLADVRTFPGCRLSAETQGMVLSTHGQ